MTIEIDRYFTVKDKVMGIFINDAGYRFTTFTWSGEINEVPEIASFLGIEQSSIEVHTNDDPDDSYYYLIIPILTEHGADNVLYPGSTLSISENDGRIYKTDLE